MGDADPRKIVLAATLALFKRRQKLADETDEE